MGLLVGKRELFELCELAELGGVRDQLTYLSVQSESQRGNCLLKPLQVCCDDPCSPSQGHIVEISEG